MDESGNHSQDDYFVVAGCWGISDRSKPTEVFDPTVQRLSSLATQARGGDPISELKGSQLSPDILEALLQTLLEDAVDDQTLRQDQQLWQRNLPFRYSITCTQPLVLTEILSDEIGNELQAMEAVKSTMLLSVIDPVFRTGRLTALTVDKVVVVLDSEMWQSPAKSLKRAIARTDDIDEPAVCDPTEIQFKTVDSVQAPGIQLADLAAYSWARYLREGDYSVAVETINRQFRFGTTDRSQEITTQATSGVSYPFREGSLSPVAPAHSGLLS